MGEAYLQKLRENDVIEGDGKTPGESGYVQIRVLVQHSCDDGDYDKVDIDSTGDIDDDGDDVDKCTDGEGHHDDHDGKGDGDSPCHDNGGDVSNKDNDGGYWGHD